MVPKMNNNGMAWQRITRVVQDVANFVTSIPLRIEYGYFQEFMRLWSHRHVHKQRRMVHGRPSVVRSRRGPLVTRGSLGEPSERQRPDGSSGHQWKGEDIVSYYDMSPRFLLPSWFIMFPRMYMLFSFLRELIWCCGKKLISLWWILMSKVVKLV